ncbi:MAG: LysM peptidoglycan-binding domain-containing protein, partial [Chloroflexota bacterium]
PFTDESGDPPRAVANGWDAWNVQRSADEPDFQNTQPEYFETVRADRIRNGNNAQRYESFFATHTGGVFQVVPNVQIDSIVTFGAYVYVWSSSLNDEDASNDDGDVFVDVGIDPTGGTDGTSEDIVWSQASEQYDAYNLYTISAPAEASTISVWVRSRVGFPVQTQIFVDDAFLTIEGSSGDPATSTSVPTATVEATVVAQVPSSTPTATATATATQVPSGGAASPTPESIETATPVSATSTPPPTSTSVPPISNEFPNTISYVVQRGDNVSRLATRFNSSVEAIQQANGLDASFLIFVGDSLIIPIPADQGVPVATSTPNVIVVTATPIVPGGGTGGVQTTYTILPGDTLSSISRRFNTTVAALAQLNGIVNPNQIFSGQTISVAPSGGQVIPTTAPQVPTATSVPIQPPAQTVYIVQPGDSLFRVSLLFGVPVSELIRANGIVNANRIFTGQQLIIP